MRINIVIDAELMAATLRATGLKTKREAVELGLRTLLRLEQQAEIKNFRGRLAWEEDAHAKVDTATRTHDVRQKFQALSDLDRP